MTEQIAEAKKSGGFQPVRLAAWACLAILSALSAQYLYQHPIQVTRSEAVAVAPTDPLKQAQQVAQQQVLAGTKDIVAELRRLSSNVSVLNSDRDRLNSRLQTIEQNIDSITGSLSRQASPPPVPPAVEKPVFEERRATSALTSSDTSNAGGPVAPVEAGASRNSFAIDLGAAPTLDGLRALWRKDLATAPMLAGLRPMVALRETPGSAFSLRLLAGPLADAPAAARLCAALTASVPRPCEPAPYEGQQLAMDVASPPPAPRKRPAPARLPAASQPQPVAPQILPR